MSNYNTTYPNKLNLVGELSQYAAMGVGLHHIYGTMGSGAATTTSVRQNALTDIAHIKIQYGDDANAANDTNDTNSANAANDTNDTTTPNTKRVSDEVFQYRGDGYNRKYTKRRKM